MSQFDYRSEYQWLKCWQMIYHQHNYTEFEVKLIAKKCSRGTCFIVKYF